MISTVANIIAAISIATSGNIRKPTARPSAPNTPSNKIAASIANKITSIHNASFLIIVIDYFAKDKRSCYRSLDHLENPIPPTKVEYYSRYKQNCKQQYIAGQFPKQKTEIKQSFSSPPIPDSTIKFNDNFLFVCGFHV